ncbi:hypothetical protein [Dyella mobilis]|uniref:Uncharacterized protein n=1 Tax=Dyella mobilis TaxID=1849582 RepID=A0ABS2KC09_9GAMM|nr:hypothetical protein [Dyella mobilis]MBM7128726.1 hypothetical protein [Dyella mobilis]GLQ99053.1 hypothetical protein GCM10007863_34730 [Dyella mobilis]
MTTVVSRTIRSTPERTASDTWQLIVALLTQGREGTARQELDAVIGIASSLIADQAPRQAPIVVTCDGPRTRIYCLYGEEARDGDDAKEDSLGFDPLNGEWSVSLPCPKDNLAWVQAALERHSSRITARDQAAGFVTEAAAETSATSLTLDIAGFSQS